MEPKQYEIIEGVMYYMAPTNLFHYNASDNLSDALKKRLDRRRFKITADVSLIPEGFEMKLFPDVAVFEKGYNNTPTGSVTSIPLFVAEVISPSSRRKDIYVKPKAYEKLGVKDYWLIDPYGQCVTVYKFNEVSKTFDCIDTIQKLSSEDKAEMENEPQCLDLPFLASSSIDIDEIFPDEED